MLQGLTQITMVLRDICFLDGGALVIPEQTLTCGRWSEDVYPGHRIAFTARYEHGREARRQRQGHDPATITRHDSLGQVQGMRAEARRADGNNSSETEA